MNSISGVRLLLLSFACPIAVFGKAVEDDSRVESFTLPVWNSDAVFDLSEQSRGVVVLDFFAYWCGPCIDASRDLERNIAAYYETEETGNASGIPVTVLSINVEQRYPEKTNSFIEKTGIRTILNDSDASLLAAMGGKGLPYFVILEGEGENWNIVYRKSGYEGHVALRSVIDSVRTSEDDNASYAFSVTAPSELAPLSRRGNLDYSANVGVLSSEDISMVSIGATARSETWEIQLNQSRIDVDYEPFRAADIIGQSTLISERSFSGQFSWNLSQSDIVQYRLSGGAYSGFADHRSMWLDEYYRQQFSGLEGYVESDPWGYNALAGVKWDTQSAFGLLGATTAFQQDDVAPGYDRPLFQPLERGRNRLYSSSLLLEQESVVSNRVRTRHQLQFVKTTDREMRYRYSGNMNVALSERLVLRLEGAATRESVTQEDQSNFRSYSGGATIEYDWDQKWFLSLSGRRYEDNGQIETSILVSSGLPPLVTNHVGVSVRRKGESVSWKFEAALYNTDFDEVDSPIRPFGNLYRDRNWVNYSLTVNF